MCSFLDRRTKETYFSNPLIFKISSQTPTLPQRITDKRTTKRTKFRSDFAPKQKKKQKLPTAISPKAKSDSPPPKNPVLSFGPKSGEAEHGEKKRRLFEQSEFLRFRRAKLRSRSETADGGFFFLLPFSFCRQKEKVRASNKQNR